MAPIPRLRSYAGPAILSYGFRPFFLLGALYAGLSILAWLPMFAGELTLPTAFALRDWHVHEMLYGFAGAVVAGFLLTAVPNWTGRLPLQGRPLLLLVAAWLAGRFAVALSAELGWLPAAILDVSFLSLLTAALGREVIAGRNWRNLKVLGVLTAMLLGNAVFHIEAHLSGTAEYGIRVGIAATLTMVMLIGGRIIPSFTRNWLAALGPGRMPVPYGRFDAVSMMIAVAALLAWVVAPADSATGAGLLIAGLSQAARLARWAGYRTWQNPLVFILHVAFAFVPLGFVLVGLSALSDISAAAGIHAWTAGAVGVMTLAVMSRASLGHTGRPLRAPVSVQAVFILATGSVLARVCAALHPVWTAPLLATATVLWAAAFLGFSAIYWRVLTGPRLT
ncbi:NnrS family protein [Methylobacterium sp. P1-11]|uniref:NnrS family protein n=1 Tax=Methylobacterium sp. P1-11 TaxID=2024616 RepID=UPI0011EE0527|nr:NnrS family protein [Methylobacterium sp. P1-11]KAA0108231.1 NnrS family protein [Methylobacterium sp. P1-11]